MTKQRTIIQILPALNSGGVERGTLEIAKALVSQGHRSIVISAGGRLVEQLEKEGSTHISLPVGEKRFSTLKMIKPLRQLFKELQPDIIHLRSRLPAWIAYFAWKKLPKTKRPHIVTTVHGPYSVNRYSAIMTIGERVIAVSETIKDYITDNYTQVNSDNITVIHRGIDTQQYHHHYTPTVNWLKRWKQDYPQLENKQILTLPARITSWKGQQDFITIIAKLKQKGVSVHGLIVGETHPKKREFLSTLEQQVRAQNLSDDISFTGYRSDIQDILAVSNIVFSLAKKPEAFGRTTIEALSMGIPVIGYNHGGVAEQLSTLFPDGLVDVNDTNGAVEKIISWQKKGHEMTLSNHQFTLEQMRVKTLNIYQSLCEEK